MDCNGSTHQQRFAEWQLLPTSKTQKKEKKLLTTRGGGGGIMEDILSMQSKRLQKGVFMMNDVMKKNSASYAVCERHTPYRSTFGGCARNTRMCNRRVRKRKHLGYQGHF